MVPFPESESMTIKRLEVALRKMDMQLLKDGAYKLHEKFHTGHDFESIAELRQIFNYIQGKDIPPEISEILCQTIKEIFEKKGINLEAQEPVSQNIEENKVKLQGPAYEQYMTQYGSSEGIREKLSLNNTLGNNPEDFLDNSGFAQIKLDVTPVEETVSEDNFELSAPEPSKEQEPPYKSEDEITAIIDSLPPVEKPIPEKTVSLAPAAATSINIAGSVAVFYDDRDSQIDYLRIKEYRNQLNILFSKNNTGEGYNLLRQISDIMNIVDVKVSDIDKVLATLSTVKKDVYCITTSQSQEITKILTGANIDFEIPFVKKANNPHNAFNLIPMLGLSNIFVCSNCNTRSLKTDYNTKTLSVQCPSCDSAAFPDLYAVNSYNPDCNPIFWHRAFAAMVKSKIWVMINPPLDENKEIIFDFIKTAYQAAAPERIYILCKENDKREFYKQTFFSIDEKCEILCSYTTGDSLCQDYISREITQKVFS